MPNIKSKIIISEAYNTFEFSKISFTYVETRILKLSASLLGYQTLAEQEIEDNLIYCQFLSVAVVLGAAL